LPFLTGKPIGERLSPASAGLFWRDARTRYNPIPSSGACRRAG